MSAPRVSVIIPVFNGARLLPETLQALSAQRYANFEVLFGDDQSTDDSPSLLARAAQRDERFRVHQMPANLGAAPRVVRRLLPEVRGEFLAYASQDDLFSPDWLEAMVARADASDADAVLPEVELLSGNRVGKRWVGLDGRTDVILSGRVATRLSLDWSIPGFALWRTALVRRVGYFDFALNADEYTARRLFFASRVVAFSGGVFRYRQDNPDAVTKKLSVGSFDIPFTHLETWRFLVDSGFDSVECDAELMRAVSSLLFYERKVGGSTFSPEQRQNARQRLAHAEHQLRTSARERLLAMLRQAPPRDRAKIALALGPQLLRRVVGTLARLR